MATQGKVQQSPRLLDCTLRDGSYQINFGFSASQTTRICKSLVECGIEMVEVGHGVGVGASEKVTEALQTDLEYARAAETGSPGKWGMFAIPGIANLKNLLPLVELGMAFVRVGVDMDKTRLGYELVSQLRSAHPSLNIFMNFMKSYTVDPSTFRSASEEAFSAGADGIYLVDSAGGMTPESVSKYADSVLHLRDLGHLGFHGHDNLGLAIGNSLALAHMGFDQVDATLMGLGRSSGNAPTEKLSALFVKLGLRSDESLDVVNLCRLAENEISPLAQTGGSHGLDVMAGFTDFHSSYMASLLSEAARSNVDAFKLMQLVTQIDKVSLTPETLRYCVSKLEGGDNVKTPSGFPLAGYSEADRL